MVYCPIKYPPNIVDMEFQLFQDLVIINFFESQFVFGFLIGQKG